MAWIYFHIFFQLSFILFFSVAKLACYVNADPKNPAGRERKYGESMLISVMTPIATLFPKSSRFSTRRLVKNQEYPAQEVGEDAHKNLRPFYRYLKAFVYEFFFLAQTSYGPAGSPVRSPAVLSPSPEYLTPPPSASDVERKIKDLVS